MDGNKATELYFRFIYSLTTASIPDTPLPFTIMDPLSPSHLASHWASSTSPRTATRPSSFAQNPNSPAKAATSSPPTPREPRVHGAPGMGLLDPSTTSQGGKGVPFLRVRIGGLERNRKDLLIRFDATVRLLRTSQRGADGLDQPA